MPLVFLILIVALAYVKNSTIADESKMAFYIFWGAIVALIMLFEVIL